MATLASSYTSNMSKAVPLDFSNSAPMSIERDQYGNPLSYKATPSTPQVVSALRGPKPQPSVPSPVATPSVPSTPTIHTPKYDFSQDGMQAGANVSGMTAQQMSQQAEAQALKARAQAEDVASMNGISVDDAYARIARAQASQAGTMRGADGTYYDPATGTYRTAIKDGGVNYLEQNKPSTPTNRQLLANFKPMYAMTGDGVGFAESGITAPKQSDYKTVDEFNQANLDYNMMKLQEAQMIANSPQVLEGRQKQAEIEAMKELKARQDQAAYDRAQKKEENNLLRDKLLQSLALRGLTPETSESARKELLKFDTLAEQSENAAASQANVAISAAMGKASSSAVEEQKKQAEAISKQIQDALAAFNTTKKTEIATGRLTLDQEKAKVDQAYKEGRINLAERDLMRKALETDATVGLKEAQTEKLDTLTPIEAEQKKAQTAKTQAETTRIQTLTPLEAQKLKAVINKTSQSKATAGGSVGDSDIAAAFDFFKASGGTGIPSSKQLSIAVNYLRETGQLKKPVEAGKKSATLQGEGKAIITPPKKSNANDPYEAFLNL